MLILLLSITCFQWVNAQRQELKLEFDKTLDNAFFHESDSMYNPLTMVFRDDNGKMHYDNVPDSNKYLIESNCMINKDPERTLRSTDARLKNDTLFITISEINASETNDILLTVYKEDLRVSFTCATPYTGTLDTPVSHCKLTLQNEQFRKGEWLKGMVRISGSCNNKLCREKNFTIEGYFKCTIE